MLHAYVPGHAITESELYGFLQDMLTQAGVNGRRVLVIIPDDTRTLPMPALFKAITDALAFRSRKLTFLVALGTHPPMTQERLERHLGVKGRVYPAVRVLQHRWDSPNELVQVGKISRTEMEELSEGLLADAVRVEVNVELLRHDFIIVLGPVFPHEIVGFSGGHKYLFPGVSGPDMIHQSHWLGALITNPKVNGHKETPPREMIERAASMVPTPRLGISLVMQGSELMGIFVGEVRDAWSAAADLSAEVNIRWVKHPFHTVLAIAPSMYQELWTAGKCMYKLEPVVKDGGTLIIYGPHIKEVSQVHGEWILRTGYHVRDYFLKQWDKFRNVPRLVLAEATLTKGIGTFREGIEQPRIEVVLATGIPEQVCKKINLAFHRHDLIDIEEFLGREEEGILVVPNAGEQLWRLSDGTVPDIDKL